MFRDRGRDLGRHAIRGTATTPMSVRRAGTQTRKRVFECRSDRISETAGFKTGAGRDAEAADDDADRAAIEHRRVHDAAPQLIAGIG